MALLSATALRGDPPLNHNFVVSLIDSSSTLATVGSAALSALLDVALGGFSEASGLEMSLKTEDYNEGGRNGTVLKFPSRVQWTNLTLKKGMSAGNGLWDWHYGFVTGKGKRRDGVVILLDSLHVPHNIWCFSRGLPVKYTGPQLNASQSSVAIESIEIAHEGIWQVPLVGYASAGAGAIATLAAGS